MLNWRPDSPLKYEDVHTLWQYHNEETDKSDRERLERLWRCSRDSARTCVQWNDGKNAGFTTGEPWFAVNDNYKEINAARQEEDPASILNFYRKAIALRKELKVVHSGAYREHDHENEKLYLYSREGDGQKLLVICSFSSAEEAFTVPEGFSLEDGKLILGNYAEPRLLLQPWECRVYLWE